MFDVLTFSISFYKAAMHGSHCLQFQGRDLSAHELLNKFRSFTTRIYIGAATAAEAQRNNSGRRDLPTMSIPSASSTPVEQQGNLSEVDHSSSTSTGNLQPIMNPITPSAITQTVNVTDTDIPTSTPENTNPPEIVIDDTDHVEGDQTNSTVLTNSGKNMIYQFSHLPIHQLILHIFHKPLYFHFVIRLDTLIHLRSSWPYVISEAVH